MRCGHGRESVDVAGPCAMLVRSTGADHCIAALKGVLDQTFVQFYTIFLAFAGNVRIDHSHSASWNALSTGRPIQGRNISATYHAGTERSFVPPGSAPQRSSLCSYR